MRDLGTEGLSFRGYGRFGDDLNNKEDVDSELYYAYLEKNGLLDNLDLRLGRQFISTTAGASLMDGIRLKYNNLGPLAVELFGGGDVSFYEGYNAEDFVAGVEVSGRFKNLNLGVSYLQKREDGDLGKELFGLDATVDFAELIQLYSEVQYDWISERVSYFLGGFKYYRSPLWSLRAEYLLLPAGVLRHFHLLGFCRRGIRGGNGRTQLSFRGRPARLRPVLPGTL